MPEFGIRSTYSQCPLQIYMWDDNGVVSTGTAFYYSTENDDFLVTTWHNVSGKNPFDQTYLDKNQRCPLLMMAKFATYINRPSGDPHQNKFTTFATKVPIYSEDRSKPLWFEHPKLGCNCDVVAIPFSKPNRVPEFMHNCANKISSIRIPVKPGNPAFIIGFPRNLSVGFGLPIWKSGFIASEPFYDVAWGGYLSLIGGMLCGNKIPAFFIDALTREGMSGSPVFASFTGTWDTSDPYQSVNLDEPGFWQRDDISLSGSAMEFVGIYSGRVPTQEGDAALGFVWKESAIKQICMSRSTGQHPHT